LRILLDQNLSPKLIAKLLDLLPGLESGYHHNLIGASDPVLFQWARARSFRAVMSTDFDLVRLAERLGPPPKVIRIARCDFPTRIIEQLLRREAIRIHEFLTSKRAVLLLKL